MERIIRQQLADYLTENNMITEDQHGARSGRSTLTQLLEQHDRILDSLMEGNILEIIYLVFAKVFHLCDISILLEKVRNIGIVGPILR